MRIFHCIQPYVYQHSGPKMAYVLTWGCSSVLLKPDPRNLGIGHNRIWAKADKVESKFSMIKDTFDKHWIVIPTREEWWKN